MMRRWVWGLLAALLFVFPARGTEVSICWDLQELYGSEEEWLADYERYEELIDHYGEYLGRMEDADAVYEWLSFKYLGEKPRLYNKLYIYTKLGLSLDPSAGEFLRLRAKLDLLESKERLAEEAVASEIYALPFATRQEIFSEGRFSFYAPYISSFLVSEEDVPSEDARRIQSFLPLEEGKWEQVYEILLSEQPWDPIWMEEEGEWEELDEFLYYDILGAGYQEDFVAEAYETFMGSFGVFRDTYACLLSGIMGENVAHAKMEGYESARDRALSYQEVPVSFYESLIEAVHEGIPDYQRYFTLHGEAFLATQYSFQRYGKVAEYDPGTFSLSEGIEMVMRALSVLGEDYLEDFLSFWEEGHVDALPQEGKVDGSFEIAVNKEILPYVLLNYREELEDVFTLCHEMSHAVYDLHSERAQADLYEAPGSFTQEVAALTGELLLGYSLLEEAESEEERLFYLENLLYLLGSTFYEQMCYAEFEEACYGKVEAGEGLQGEELCELFLSLLLEYEGEGVVKTPGREFYWIQLSHLYMDHYLYQYAGAISLAASLSQAIWREEEGALERYMEFLAAGNRKTPQELLSLAGVEMGEEVACRDVVELFASLLDEYEELLWKLGYLEEAEAAG